MPEELARRARRDQGPRCRGGAVGARFPPRAARPYGHRRQTSIGPRAGDRRRRPRPRDRRPGCRGRRPRAADRPARIDALRPTVLRERAGHAKARQPRARHSRRRALPPAARGDTAEPRAADGGPCAAVAPADHAGADARGRAPDHPYRAGGPPERDDGLDRLRRRTEDRDQAAGRQRQRPPGRRPGRRPGGQRPDQASRGPASRHCLP